MTFPIFVCRKSGKFEHCRNRLLRSFKRHCHRRRKLFLLQRTKLIITPIYPVPGTGQADMTFFQQPIICIGTKTVGEMFADFLLLLMHFSFSGRTAKDEISRTVSTVFSRKKNFIHKQGLQSMKIQISLCQIFQFIKRDLYITFVHTIHH